MKSILHYLLLLLIPTVVLIHLTCAPFTKVEESFNIQAIHDILFYGIPIGGAKERLASHFDHATFPGAVPRTFVGAVFVAQILKLFTGWITDPERLQLIARGVLGMYNALALIGFQDAVGQAFGTTAARWYILLQISQFHVMYYASRTLPNMFAFGMTTTALRFLILSNFGGRNKRQGRNRVALYLLTIAGIIFRSELAILLATECAWLFLIRKLSIRTVIIPAGLLAATIGLLATVTIDSFFWQQFPLWPEWVAFRYNTLEGKASEWGTSPWYFYFLNAIPRLMMNPMTLLVCLPLALADRSTRTISIDMLSPLLAFVAIYSILPHKEWRFILYVIPGLTAIAAAGASSIWNRRSRSLFSHVLALALVGSTLASFMASMGLLAISSLNYPGAAALQRLHAIADGERPLIRVHLDNLSCQTGVTRFLQKRIDSAAAHENKMQTVWYYDKTEDDETLKTPAFWERFDYVLAENPISSVLGKWETIDSMKAYAGIGVSRDIRPLNEVWPGIARGKPGSLQDVVRRCLDIWRPVELLLRQRVTGGRWLVLKMEPRIHILRKTE